MLLIVSGGDLYADACLVFRYNGIVETGYIDTFFLHACRINLRQFGVIQHYGANGALGGFTTGRKEIIDLLRQRSRPYLFSNSLAPGIIGASLEVFKMLKESDALHDKLVENVNYFRDKMTAAGLTSSLPRVPFAQ